MTTITQARLEIADCTTTLRYLEANASDGPLPFSNADVYNNLYEKISSTPRSFEELSGTASTILKSFRRIYSENKYWRKYLRASDIGSSYQTAWNKVLPVDASLTERIDLLLPGELRLQVSPMLRVVLYPFGWSTWLSFKIVGEFTLTELASLVRHLAEQKAYRLESNPASVVTLTDLFDRLNKRVSLDAFGKNANAVNPQEFLRVMTVLAKHGGSPSLAGMTADEELALKQILRPEGPVRIEPIAKFAIPLRAGDDPSLNFVLHDGRSWFLWAEHLLKSEGRNFNKLQCLHNNIFRSLQQSWLIHNLLMQATGTRVWSPVLKELLDHVTQLVSAPGGVGGYRNVSLLTFLQGAEFQASLAAVQKRLAPPG